MNQGAENGEIDRFQDPPRGIRVKSRLAAESAHLLHGARSGVDRNIFRSQPNGDRKSKQKCGTQIAFGKSVEQENHRNHQQHRSDEQPTDAIDSAVETGRGTLGD
jgi:hypothetical protein